MNARVLPVVLSALLLSACTAAGGTPYDSPFASEDLSGQASDGFPAPSKTVVWETAMRAVREQGFVPDPSLSRMEAGVVSTRWRVSLQPFGSRGYRERATIRIRDVKGRQGYYRLETNVIRQSNDNQTEPSNPIAASWTEGVRATDQESLLNARVEMYFLPNDVSPEFRRKYGMPGVESPRIRGDR